MALHEVVPVSMQRSSPEVLVGTGEMEPRNRWSDLVVVGGGLSGLAAAHFFARSGIGIAESCNP